MLLFTGYKIDVNHKYRTGSSIFTGKGNPPEAGGVALNFFGGGTNFGQKWVGQHIMSRNGVGT